MSSISVLQRDAEPVPAYTAPAAAPTTATVLASPRYQGSVNALPPSRTCAWALSQVEVPKPSEGLEYTYARKPSNFDHERKDLAHIWEVGGSQEFAEQIAQSDQLFLTVKQVGVATHTIHR